MNVKVFMDGTMIGSADFCRQKLGVDCNKAAMGFATFLC
jgi:hypothetical protein